MPAAEAGPRRPRPLPRRRRRAGPQPDGRTGPDPARSPGTRLSDFDLYLLAEGTHYRS